jgi:Bacteriocin-protection, YdeI or OmpD-Associated/Domain of unknown function (DUF1905)
MPPLRFRAVIKIVGVNPYVSVSAARARSIRPAWRKPMPVLIRINGVPKKSWRTNMMPKGDGSFYLYLHGNVRKASGTKVGDKVDVEIEFDAKYRNGPMHPMPASFRSMLSEDPIAKQAWASLPPSRKKEILRYFAALKSTEARARNLARMIHILSGNDDHFMGRDWKNGK